MATVDEDGTEPAPLRSLTESIMTKDEGDLATILAETAKAIEPLAAKLYPQPAPLSADQLRRAKYSMVFGALAGRNPSETVGGRFLEEHSAKTERAKEVRAGIQAELLRSASSDVLQRRQEERQDKRVRNRQVEDDVRTLERSIAAAGGTIPSMLPDDPNLRGSVLERVLSNTVREAQTKERRDQLVGVAMREGRPLPEMNPSEFSIATSVREDKNEAAKDRKMGKAIREDVNKLMEKLRKVELAEVFAKKEEHLANLQVAEAKLQEAILAQTRGYFGGGPTWDDIQKDDFALLKGKKGAALVDNPLSTKTTPEQIPVSALVEELKKIKRVRPMVEKIGAEFEGADAGSIDELLQRAVEASKILEQSRVPGAQ